MLQDKDLVQAIAKSNPSLDPNTANSAIDNLVDLTQLIIGLQPFLTVMVSLCEEARAHVLAESIGHTDVDEGIDELIRNLWLSDIDVSSGRQSLNRSIKDLPNAKLLRHAVMAHLMMRVFWKHWLKSDRLSLLDSADLSLRGLGMQHKTGELTRIVERLKETEEFDG